MCKRFVIYISLVCSIFFSHAYSAEFSVLNRNWYDQTLNASRLNVQRLEIKLNKQLNLTDRLILILNQLLDTAYLPHNAMGEGDWQSAKQINQYPVYRLDSFDCQTFVQVVMALLYSHDVQSFETQLINIAYHPYFNKKNRVDFFNRNHFVELDFNQQNQKNQLLQDITSTGQLSHFASHVTFSIDKKHWFQMMQYHLNHYVYVFNASYGNDMINQMLDHTDALDEKKQTLSLAYFPKEKMALKQSDGGYLPNNELLNRIPTPAIVEIIRNPKKWTLHYQPIKDVIGTELVVSHLGIIYRKTFKKNELIYRKITCNLNAFYQKQCEVKPIVCLQNICQRLMFVHASNAYPDGYYWYANEDNQYVCSPNPPKHPQKISFCNRVEQMPLFDYLTNYQYGQYRYMNSPSILGMHVELLTSPKNQNKYADKVHLAT